jgi:dolichol-phosphate mannosyltransferase
MAGDAAPAWSPPTLSIIVPAYQESYNAPILFERVKAVVNGVQWEMTVVDDDSRMEPPMSLLRSLRQTSTLFEACQSLGSRLAGAVIEGWMSSSADFLAAIDGDLQHDESIVLRMYQVLAKGSGNLAIGTRPRKASSGSLSPGAAEAERYRRAGLQANCRDGRYRSNEWLTIRREIVSRLAPCLSPDGFKILVDVILSADSLSIVEAPTLFRRRNAGESKLTLPVWVGRPAGMPTPLWTFSFAP